jgi:acetate kinase
VWASAALRCERRRYRPGFLGIAVDSERSANVSGDADIGAGVAAVRTLLVEAREDLELARQVRAVVAAGRGAPQ